VTLHVVPAAPEPALNPAQEEALALIREPRAARPRARPELRAELRELLEEGLAPLAAGLERPLVLTKHLLASVHGCEARHVHQAARPFEPSAATVRGTVAHKAIEYSVSNMEGSPGRLVDRAIARLTDGEEWSGAWLRQSDETDRTEVRALAVDRVSKFVECFPPLHAGWRPVPESALRADLCDGRVALRGKVDLTLGTPEGMQAAKVIIDFKTGGRAITHVEDLRFYALVETLRLGVPPWKVVSYYLEAAAFQVEVVTEGMLEAAARRVIAGATKLVELQGKLRQPTRTGGPTCSWCPLFDTCPDGQRAKAAWDEWRG
jgi:hypothetical protein